VGVHNFVLGLTALIGYAFFVACTTTPPNLKNEVAHFWNVEPCGSRYVGASLDFEVHSRTRYALEPYIHRFAQFSASQGKRVLEIGVGIGSDYVEWLKAGAIATGVDLSAQSIERARFRCQQSGLVPDLRVADAEDLPFNQCTFDILYSYGVMHHSPDTQHCLNEAWRVLKPGGEVRIMLYHHRSLTGLMLWLQFGIWRRQSLRRCVYERLESPGTKTFTKDEVRDLMQNFEHVQIEQVFSPGDLLLHEPSKRFRAPIHRLAWMLFPRRLVRAFGKRLGLFLLINAKKPSSDEQTSGLHLQGSKETAFT